MDTGDLTSRAEAHEELPAVASSSTSDSTGAAKCTTPAVSNLKKTAKTTKERVRAYRERVKQNKEKHDALKMKDAIRKHTQRATRKKLSPSDVKRERELNVARVRRFRAKKVQETREQPCSSNDSIGSYKSPQSFGRAVRRLRSTLPKSPRKRKALVSKLAISESLWKKKKPEHNPVDKALHYDEIIAFYQRDDISWQTPGIKDYIIIRSGGQKDKIQKRYLNMTVFEAYRCFKEEYPDFVIGKSKFAELRPSHVLKRSETPRNVCLCHYHENINLQIQALHSKGYDFPKSSGDLVENCVCDSSNFECMSGKCAACGNMQVTKSKVTDHLIANSAGEMITWYRWETKENRMVKVEQKGTVTEMVNEFILNDIPKFLLHVYIKRKQSKSFESIKNSLKEDDTCALIQVDFSENYTAEYQDEVQSAHWHQRQVTLFTVAVWTQNNCDSYAIVSDSLDHDKNAVAKFMSHILHEVVQKFPQIHNIDIFSDGAASQFKNKYMFKYLCHLYELTGLQLQWHFFATSHGKGAVDGIGGSIKRLVSCAVSSRSHIVQDAASFATAAIDNNTKVHVLLITKEDISTFIAEKHLGELWTGVSAIKGTQGIHWLKPVSRISIQHKPYSLADSSNSTRLHFFEENSGEDEIDEEQQSHTRESLLVGSFARVKFLTKKSRKYFVAQITGVHSDGYTMKFLRRQGSTSLFIYCDEEESYVEQDQIMEALPYPTLDNRNRCSFQKDIIAE